MALIGYFAAAHIVDNPSIGRRRLQQYGFVATGTLFSLCALLQENFNPLYLLILYLLSSFFGQCGPNCTTFLLPAEIFPTESRTAFHGISASAGKLGAVIAVLSFHRLENAEMFWACGLCSFIAAGVTFCCIPDTTTLDIYELDRHWRLVADRREEAYTGPAMDWQYLARLERRKTEEKGEVENVSRGNGVVI